MESEHIYTTVLKSISIHTIVFKKCFELAEKLEISKKYLGNNSNDYWTAQAYRDFINALEFEAKKIKDLQNDTLNKIVFLIK